MCLGSVYIHDLREGKHYVAHDRIPDGHYIYFPELDECIGRGEWRLAWRRYGRCRCCPRTSRPPTS